MASAALVFALAAAFNAAHAEQAAGQPNILVIIADDLGWGDVGYHGSEIDTPHIDRLAAQGLHLHQHYVTPMCSSTRACLLSGRYCTRYGLDGATNAQVFPFGTVTLASALKEAGYDTCLTGKWHLGSKAEAGPLQFGFNRSHGSLAGGVDQYLHLYKKGPFQQTWHRNDKLIDEEGHATDLIGQEAVRYIEAQREKPFYVQVAFTAVHIPIQEPEEYIAPYRDRIENASRRNFAACLTHMDHWVGQMLAALDRTGQRENTLVLFFSDNGGSGPWKPAGLYPGQYEACPVLGNNLPLRGRKGTVYEGGIRVPAVIAWAGQLPVGKYQQPMHVVDWMPTLLHLAGYNPRKDLNWDGQNVWPQLAAADKQPPADGKGSGTVNGTGDRAATVSASPRQLYFKRGNAAALRQGDWKLIEQGNRRELYNLADDPYEEKDLASKLPHRVTELAAQLAEQRKKDNSDVVR